MSAPLPKAPDRDLGSLAASPVHWVAECHLCGRAFATSAADMFQYLRDGWPPCCRHPMTFRVVRAPLPPAGETWV